MHPDIEKLYKKVNEKLAITTGGAIGVTKQVAEAAKAALIGEALVWTVAVDDTSKETLKVPVASIASGTILTTEAFDASSEDSETYSYATMDLNLRAFSGANWNEGILENMPFDLVSRQVDAVGYALGEQQSWKIIDLIETEPDDNLAGTISTGTLTVEVLIDGVTAVKNQNFLPTVIMMNPAEYGALLKEEKFSSSLYVGTPSLPTGIRSELLGCDIVVSSLVTSGSVHILAKDIAVCYAPVAGPDVKEWETGATGALGIRGRQRFGAKVVQPLAIYRITIA